MQLSERFGWTPREIADLTLPQLHGYLRAMASDEGRPVPVETAVAGARAAAKRRRPRPHPQPLPEGGEGRPHPRPLPEGGEGR